MSSSHIDQINIGPELFSLKLDKRVKKQKLIFGVPNSFLSPSRSINPPQFDSISTHKFKLIM